MTGRRLSPYGLAFLSAFVLGYLFVFSFLKRRQIPRRVICYSFLFQTPLILYGAKLYSVIASGFRDTILTAGFSGLGGALGLLVGVCVFNRMYTGHSRTFFTAYTLALPLLYSISKLGCHFAGCCRGIAYHGPLAVSYHNVRLDAEALFPVQMTESIVFFLIFLVGVLFYKRKEAKTTAAPIALVMLLCSAAKFSLEYLREEHRGVVLSMNQIVCIFFFLLSLALFGSCRRQQA